MATTAMTNGKDGENGPIEIEALSLKEEAPKLVDDIPDGGYGWVVLLCCFSNNAATWGLNSTFGVYLSFFIANSYYPGATALQFSFVGGLSIGLALFVAPLANYISKAFHFKISMVIGICLFCFGQIAAAYTTQIWQLFLTQGVMFGCGNGFLMVPTIPLPSQWFSKKRALAAGIAASGSGVGGLIFSITTRIIIERHSLKWAFIANGLISLAILIPVTIFAQSRTKALNAKFEPLQASLLVHPAFAWVWIWGAFSMLGYVLALYTLPTFAVQALGFTQSQGSTLQAVLCGGQAIGRPLVGLALDRYGRINMAALFTLISGLSILVIWMPARSFGILIFFAVVQGIVGGVFWGASGPVTAEAVGMRDMGSALAILWLSVVLPCTFSQAIGSALSTHMRDDLNYTGASVYLPLIGFAGGSFVIAAFVLLQTKFYVQKNHKLLTKT